ncbi:MAG TPA: anti-sigma factor [Solirubrobacteraceae bacterium]
MGPPDCEKRDTASAYLLGALPDQEFYSFEVHLAGCAFCQREVQQLASAVDILGTSVPPVQAPPDLGARIKGIVRAEAELLHAAGPEADRPAPAPPRRVRADRWRGWRPRIAVAATLAVGVLCGLVIGSSLLSGTTTSTRAISADILQPNLPPDASATLHITGANGTLSLSHFPSPPAGRVYEVWRVVGAKKLPGALFSVNSQGSGTAAVPGISHDVGQILVTAEPLGGSPAPTSNPIISANTTA